MTDLEIETLIVTARRQAGEYADDIVDTLSNRVRTLEIQVLVLNKCLDTVQQNILDMYARLDDLEDEITNR